MLPSSARTTPMPSLYELDALFSGLPFLPPPVPRRRTPYTAPGKSNSVPQKPKTSVPSLPTPQDSRASLMQRLLEVLRRLLPFLYIKTLGPGQEANKATAPRRVNPFAVLKAGKKMVVVAAVDAGTISFFRFGQGAFEDFPMN